MQILYSWFNCGGEMKIIEGQHIVGLFGSVALNFISLNFRAKVSEQVV